MKTINKKILKSGYYWECDDFFSKLPENLKVSKYNEAKFDKTLTHEQILKKYKIKPWTLKEAAGIVADYIIKHSKQFYFRLFYFKHNDIMYRFGAYRIDDDQLFLNVHEVDGSDEYGAGLGACFSTLESSPSHDTLELKNLIKDIKEILKKYE